MIGDNDEGRSLRDEVAALDWYHTIELAPGLVTPGWFDLREVTNEIPWPDLTGKRCLDVGTFDGFWAFEMERRGATEVVGVDILDPSLWDWPVGSPQKVVEQVGKRKGVGRGFEIVHEVLGSSVRRVELSVYDLDPDELGTFDVVYLGSILLHLRDPVRALERVRTVCTGDLIVVDAVDLALSTMTRRPVAVLDGRDRPWWWKPNVAGLVRMVEAGGFQVVGGARRIFMPPGPGQPLPPMNPRMLASRGGRETIILKWRGDPHAVLRAHPR